MTFSMSPRVLCTLLAPLASLGESPILEVQPYLETSMFDGGYGSQAVFRLRTIERWPSAAGKLYCAMSQDMPQVSYVW
jgi:hypothetical protein